MHTVRDDRHQLLVDHLRFCAARQSKQRALARAVDIRIEQSDASPGDLERQPLNWFAIVDLPTPPLPEATATIWATPFIANGVTFVCSDTKPSL